MKTKIHFLMTGLVAVLVFHKANATIRTVCNYPVNVAQFNTIQSAIDASSSGDTLLVQGSNVQYTGITIILDKKICIIGPGFNPLRQTPALKAMVQIIQIKGTASSGTEIQGLYFTGDYYDLGIQTEWNVSINNLKILRNYFVGKLLLGSGNGNGIGITCTGYTIEGNYFASSELAFEYSNHIENTVIQNNVFYNTLINRFSLCNNVLVNHNLFYRNNLDRAFFDAIGLTIQNNIFSKSEPGGTNVTSNCTFRSNITFNTGVTPAWTINGNSNQGGNVLGQDPKMVDQSAVNTGTNNPLLNFTIQSGSPAKNTGSDAKDMGLLYDASGSLNWNNSRMSRIPYVFNVNIANNTIEPNGTLNVSIEARKQN